MHEAHATPTTAKQEKLAIPNAECLYKVTRSDLPIRCPMPGASLWDSHPRVFLALEKAGRAKCPYCSAEYLLSPE